MKCKEIYDSALRVLAESTLPADNDDYEERAPYLIATQAADGNKMFAAKAGY